MREIKFRLWDQVNEKFIYCDLFDINKGFLSSVNEEDHIPQEYTGLTDRNGQEIYEGDILFCENLTDGPNEDVLSRLEITWCDISLCWRGASKTDDGFSAIDMMLCEVDEERLVVGNIFEGVGK